MKKLIFLIFLVSLFLYCGPKQEKVERYTEDGVEVVINHLEPYEIKGEPSTFILDEEFTIDTERDDIAELGLTDIGVYFDADSNGNIYLASHKNTEGIIFKFDRYGNFIRSFVRKGQGPGELQAHTSQSLCLNVDHKDHIAVSDFGNKISKFGSEGNLIGEVKLNSNIIYAIPLENGNYLTYIRVMDPSAEFINQNPLSLYNNKFEEIKQLDLQKIPNPIIGKRLKGTYHILSWSVSRGRIFTGFQERGYEIYVYDLEGNLLQKIKKEYKPVPVPEEHKKKIMKDFKAPIFDDIRNKIYFPHSMPPYQSFFTDDEGRLLVMTYEKGKNPGEYIYDIFNPDGIFISSKSLRVFNDESGVYAKIKNGRFYCLNEKDSGYKELVVYRMKWE